MGQPMRQEHVGFVAGEEVWLAMTQQTLEQFPVRT